MKNDNSKLAPAAALPVLTPLLAEKDLAGPLQHRKYGASLRQGRRRWPRVAQERPEEKLNA